MAMEKESVRHKEKVKILSTAMMSRGKFETAITRDTSVMVGRAVVIAHGIGGSASHASMKSWKKRFAASCDEVFLFNFPRPFQMASATAAFAQEIARARAAGHKRIVLAGVGAGARAMLHLITALPAEDDEPIQPLVAQLREAVKGIIALGYPLLRAGSSEVRDGVIRALPIDAPPLLMLVGDADPHMDLAALDRARKACASKVELRVVAGADSALFAKDGTQAARDASTMVDTVLSAFVGAALGSSEEYSKRRKLKKATSTGVGPGLTERAAQNSQEQARLKQVDHIEARKLEEQLASARAAKKAEQALLTTVDLTTVANIVVTECGCSDINGTYRADSVRDGVPSYRQVDGDFTIERDSAPNQATQWCLCRDYGFITWCFVDAEDDLPPSDGWSVSDTCTGPPPTLSLVSRDSEGQIVPRQEVLQAHCSETRERNRDMRTTHVSASMSSRRKKRLQNNLKHGIKKRRIVKGR